LAALGDAGADVSRDGGSIPPTSTTLPLGPIVGLSGRLLPGRGAFEHDRRDRVDSEIERVDVFAAVFANRSCMHDIATGCLDECHRVPTWSTSPDVHCSARLRGSIGNKRQYALSDMWCLVTARSEMRESLILRTASRSPAIHQ